MIPLSRLATTYQLPTNPLYQEKEKIEASGGEIVDLISGNVTEQGIRYPEEILKEIFGRAVERSRIYRPNPLGQIAAREAVSGYYAGRQITLPPSQILLTPGTSLAYWYLFAVLANSGDEILVPRPSYPLFDEIARLAGVRLIHYRLIESRSWAVDLEDLAGKIGPRSKALVLISPHHPTGSVIAMDQLEAIAGIAVRHRLPIISDEVFGEFLFGIERLPRPLLTDAPLVITLNGFSKLFALPGIKFGWMALSGQSDGIRPFLNALESISDAFLPVNEVVQAAAPEIFRYGRTFLDDYRQEIRRRRAAVIQKLSGISGISFVPPQGGFYVSVRVGDPGERDDETLALEILRKTGCLVHPGYFYDLEPTHLVFSLVSEPKVSLPALDRVISCLRDL